MALRLIPAVHADAVDGTLTLVQRWRLQLAVALARRRRPRASALPPPAQAELEHPAFRRSLQPPQGRLAHEAWVLARAQLPPWLLEHSLRTHAWAQACALLSGLRPDGEQLFAACLLHDIGLTPAACEPPSHCFALRGARFAAARLANVASADAVRSVAEAIARHLDFQVDAVDGVEAHLLQAGAMIDVTGRGLARLPRQLQVQVLSEFPRLQAKAQLCRCMQAEAAHAGGTRIGLYVRRFGFLDLIRNAPFNE